ncbi:hypothetical protein D3C87_2162320 [compost metagenome]
MIATAAETQKCENAVSLIRHFHAKHVGIELDGFVDIQIKLDQVPQAQRCSSA